MKSYLFLLLLNSAILFLWSGCKRYTRPGDPQEVSYAMYEDIKDWDPAAAFSLEVMALGNIYEPLHWYEPDSAGAYHFRPALAKTYEKDANGLNWTFHLRRGVHFHDGLPFTSLAVKKSIERVKRIGKGAAFIWDAVKNIETPDDSTVIFRLSRPAPIDLIAASQYGAWIMSPAVADCSETYFRWGKADGTGPYMLKNWEQNRQIDLQAFPDYWGGWQGKHFKQVTLKIISEAGTRIQMIRSGEVDFAGLIPPENINALRHNPDIRVRIFPSWRNMMFLLNTSRFPTDNRWIRRALLSAFDYRAAVEYILQNFARRATAPVPAGIWGHAVGLPQPQFDLIKARRFVEESGIPKDKLKLTLSYVASVDAYEKCAIMLQNILAKIGIRLELQPGLWNVIWDRAKKTETAPNMVSMTWWPSYPTPGDWLRGLFHSQSPNLFNLSHYNNPDFDQIVDRAAELEAADRPAAIALYQQAQRILYDDAVAIFFADLKIRMVQRRSVSGLKANPAYDTMIYFYNLQRTEQ